ncbi:FecR domain-containing protein [Pigmentiphaga aceris]|uniref:FecR domain-containing protein n=1 Tax=Pigmentiphaga aceris TaxID=1940612 RepID=A0A5C0B327_9BURK|nr:FecR domain-containing protein [Pigmentiphaga aceris]QEI08665.1 FecR domain-containing protein [Pigmentiphaga aceris]
MKLFPHNAMMAVACVAMAVSAHASTPDASVVGTVTFALGDASLIQADGSSTPLKRGNAVHQTDSVQTGVNGQVHVRMVDQALVSVRPNSRLVIQDYRYDAQDPAKSIIRFSLEQGTMRSITGAGGHAAKDQYRLNTPLAAIGIRGTDFTVAATSLSTTVGVHSGAIEMTPYGANCLQDGLGACGGGSGSVLTAAMRDLQLQLARGEGRPSYIPATKLLDALPDEPNAKRREDTSVAGSAQTGARTEAVAEVNAVKVVVAPVAPPPVVMPVAPVEPTPPVVIPVMPDVIVPPSAKPPAQVAVYWGRYETLLADGRKKLGNNAEVTVGNDTFGLMRAAGTMALPTSEKFSFALGGSEAYIISGGKSVTATITDPRLTIDFAQRVFDTSLTVSAPGTTAAVAAQGTINNSGFLYSNAGTPNTSVLGTLNADGTQAGYVFSRDLSADQRIRGATTWYR